MTQASCVAVMDNYRQAGCDQPSSEGGKHLNEHRPLRWSVFFFDYRYSQYQLHQMQLIGSNSSLLNLASTWECILSYNPELECFFVGWMTKTKLLRYSANSNDYCCYSKRASTLSGSQNTAMTPSKL